MSQNRSFRPLRKLSSESLDERELVLLAATVSKMEARPATLVLVSQLEHALDYAIRTYLPNMDDDDYDALFANSKPLSSFWAHIWLGHCIGMYGDQTRYELEIIRNVRNAFAHSARLIDFQTPEISEFCAEITITERTPNSVPHFPMEGPWPSANPRHRFLNSCACYWEVCLDIALGRTTEYPLD